MIKNFLLIPALMLAPLSANATLSWNFTGSGQNYGSQHTFSGSTGAGNVIVSAFSTTGNPENGYGTFEDGTLGSWSGGIGVQSQEDGSFGDAPNHAFDNDGNGTDEKPAGDVDAAVFSFNQSVSLNSLSIGWHSGDADISVLAYTGNTGSMTNPENIVGKTFTDLLSSGWEFIGNYMNVYNMPNDTATINPSDKSSSYWLVSAYTSCANNGCNASDGYFGNDYFKISGLGGNITGGGSGNTGSVPEPSSLLLFAGGLLGWRLNRYSKAQAESNEALAA
ncbi:MAG: PEP-CTERM sorting domain-containing protein [Methylomonas lenta]|nr:PEP-CTERM sorting domain-containing protein [Methylomonas lenta]